MTMDDEIKVIKPTAEMLEEMGVFDWPVWEKAASRFPWHYDEMETCYLLEGRVTVTPAGLDNYTFGKGDMVIFPKGMACFWEIHEDVRKHYRFG